MANIRDFNFYTFLQDITNQSIEPLQGNERYNDLVRGIESIFNKLYRRVQEISIFNSLDLDSDRSFLQYIPNNQKTINDVTKPYKDVLLEQLSLYLDTDHFKDTAATLMRIWQKRQIDGGLIGANDENLDAFIEEYIIPSFKLFTKTAGDLHKSKGIQVILERLFEYYGEPNTDDRRFDGVIEHDTKDTQNRRFKKLSSIREGITLESLLKNYSNIQIFTNVNLKITHYLELGIHRFVVADGYLFISRKDREDWHIINIVDDIYRLNSNYLVIKQYKTLSLYSDRINLYNPETNEFVLPETLPDINITDAEFTPKIINIEDKFNQYHENNFYFINLTYKPSGGFGCFQYNLKRIRHYTESDYLSVETIQPNMGITYLDLMYKGFGEFPQAEKIISVDYLWLNFYDPETTELLNFNPNPSDPNSLQDVKLAYSFIIKEVVQVDDGDGGYTYPIHQFLCTTRDGYNYDWETIGFQYNVVGKIADDLVSKYILQERNVSNIFESELNKIIGDDVKVQTALDLFVPQVQTINQTKRFTNRGYWDANNIQKAPPSFNPADGDYWIVSNAGGNELNGITVWNYNDIVSWNAKHNYWEKNNWLRQYPDEKNTVYAIEHKIIVIGDKEFLNDEMKASSPYEKNCSMFEIQLSSLELNIENFSKIFWIDINPIEKFGVDADIILSYIDKSTLKPFIYYIKMNGFYRENTKLDMYRVMRGNPTIDAQPVIYKMEITDKTLIVYCEKFLNVADSKSTAMILDNTTYLIPTGIRTNKINIYYDANVRTETRANQIYYREYTSSNEVNTTITGEEVEGFKNVLARYAPINTENEWLQENIDVGISKQKIADGQIVDSFPITVPNFTGDAAIQEVSKLNMRDFVALRIDGDPEYPNCDCVRFSDILYLHDFAPMTLFYNYETQTANPNLDKVPSCVPAVKLGKLSDKYSNNEVACRFDTGYFYYTYYDGQSTLPTLVRSRFRINNFERLQRVLPQNASEPMVFNWSIHCQVDVFVDDPYATFAEWVTVTDEEIFAPLSKNNECSPSIIYYTSMGDDPLTTIVGPWDIFNVPALKVNVNYDCAYTPWVPDMADYVFYHDDYPKITEDIEYPVVRVPPPNKSVTFEVWTLNSWLDGFEITGYLGSEGVSYPVNIRLEKDTYESDPNLEANAYTKRYYQVGIGPSSSLIGTQIIYNTKGAMTFNPRVGRLKLIIDNEIIYDTGFKNGRNSIIL